MDLPHFCMSILPGRSAGSAGTHSQADSTNPPSLEEVQAVQVFIPRQAALTLSPGGVQAVQALIPRQAGVFSQSWPRHIWHYSGGCCFFPRKYIKYHQRTRAKTWWVYIKVLSETSQNVYFSFINYDLNETLSHFID